MLRTMLLGLDGSDYSSAAMLLGIEWARRADAMLVGLGIIDEPEIRDAAAVPLGAGFYKQQSDADRVSQARRRVDQLLEQFTLRCTEAGISSKLLEDVGEPAARITLEAQRYDLILLGSQTYFHFATQEGPDQTLAAVVRGSPRPVVAVPAQGSRGSTTLVAYDGSLYAARALYCLVASGLAAWQPVHVLSVHSDRVEAGRVADRAVEYLGFHGVQATRHTHAGSDDAGLLLDEARRLDAGLIVMGAYSKSSLRELFFGSVTRRLLAESQVPLLLTH
jgi:nucleotide-binding universal stress UspA family protein